MKIQLRQLPGWQLCWESQQKGTFFRMSCSNDVRLTSLKIVWILWDLGVKELHSVDRELSVRVIESQKNWKAGLKSVSLKQRIYRRKEKLGCAGLKAEDSFVSGFPLKSKERSLSFLEIYFLSSKFEAQIFNINVSNRKLRFVIEHLIQTQIWHFLNEWPIKVGIVALTVTVKPFNWIGFD